jgi:hypothetical protein
MTSLRMCSGLSTLDFIANRGTLIRKSGFPYQYRHRALTRSRRVAHHRPPRPNRSQLGQCRNHNSISVRSSPTTMRREKARAVPSASLSSIRSSFRGRRWVSTGDFAFAPEAILPTVLPPPTCATRPGVRLPGRSGSIGAQKKTPPGGRGFRNVTTAGGSGGLGAAVHP